MGNVVPKEPPVPPPPRPIQRVPAVLAVPAPAAAPAVNTVHACPPANPLLAHLRQLVFHSAGAGLKDILLILDSGTEAQIFAFACDLFVYGVSLAPGRVTIDDLIDVKGKLAVCNVACALHEDAFAPRRDGCEAAFRTGLADSRLRVCGAYEVAFSVQHLSATRHAPPRCVP